MSWYKALLDESIEDETRLAMAFAEQGDHEQATDCMMSIAELSAMEVPEQWIPEWMIAMCEDKLYTAEEYALYFVGRGPRPW